MTEYALREFLRKPFDDTNRDTGTVSTLLRYLFGNTYAPFTQARTLIEDTDTVRLGQHTGSVTLSDGRNLGIFDVDVTDAVNIARNRKGLRDIAAGYIDQNIIHGALVFFHNANRPDDYRLTFIARYSAFDLDTLDLVKHETAPKRFAFVLGPNEPCATASRRLMQLVEKQPVNLKALTDAFAVEPLNREFFKQFKDVHFKKIWNYLAEHYWTEFLGDEPMPAEPKEKDRKAKPIRDFAKKMLGRIVFLHFLQKKGWMGCPALVAYEATKAGQPIPTTPWTNGDKRFVQTLFEQFAHPDQFYSRCLTKLFFDTLNNPDRTNFTFAVDGMKPCRVPYLNGGLFDRDIRPDGQPVADTIDLPTEYFQSLLQFFDQYNFTIDENSPGDYEVGIDPEMLGHIFENLLEENREKGAFYTPKEIVQYMCQESLIQHLTHHLTADLGETQRPAIQTAITDLIRAGSRGDERNRHNLITQHAPRIEDLLDTLKICDPAIGSGAFPVGMLQEIFAAKMTLDLTLNRAEVKKAIIRETIYGVDMEPGAVDIARLRFWLSLVVDEDEPQPLPNLDYKIMQGDSLLESFEGVIPLTVQNNEVDPTQGVVQNAQLGIDGKLPSQQLGFAFGQNQPTMSARRKEKLRKLIQAYFKARQQKVRQKGDKADIRQQINDEIDAHIDECIKAEQAKWTLAKDKIIGELFMARQGQKSAKTPAKQREYEKTIARKERELEMFQKLLNDEREREIRLARSKQNPEKGYFLWRLFFPEVFEKGGFDIVIANPPYIQLARIPTEAAQYQREGYQTFEKTGDIYGLFYEQGVRLLRPGGVLTCITSNSWLQTQYGKPLRQLFVQQTDPLTLLNFADTRLFETAVVETNILLTRKAECRYQLQAATVGADYDKDKESLPDYIARNAFTLSDLPAEGWAVGDAQASLLKKLMEENGNRLRDWPNPISRGVITGFNTAYVINEAKLSELLKASQQNAALIKPTLKGRDLRRYIYSFEKKYIIIAKYGSNEYLQSTYPAIYQHLAKYETELKNRGQCRYGGKGNTGMHHWLELDNKPTDEYLSLFEKPKIIWGRISDTAKFAYDESRHYVLDTQFIMTGNSLKYLLSVLNSKIAKWYFDQIATTTGMGTSQWLKYKIEQLPVPEPSGEVDAQLTALVDTVLTLKRQSPGADTLAYEAQIDALVFRAYGLSETDMLYVLDQFTTVGSREREMIQNNFRNLARGHFSVLS